MPHFRGSIYHFKKHVEPLMLKGEWKYNQVTFVWTMKTANRAVISFSGTKGTVWFQGPVVEKEDLEQRYEALSGLGKSELSAPERPEPSVSLQRADDSTDCPF
jgi:hypothetical protein